MTFEEPPDEGGPDSSGDDSEENATLYRVVHDILRGANYHREQAVRALCTRIEKDAQLRLLFALASARYFVRQAEANIRYRLCTMKAVPAGKDDASHVVSAIARSWSFSKNFPLESGAPLGVAIAEELIEDLRLLEANRKGLAIRIAFEKEIVRRLKPGKKVSECLTEKQIKKIWEQVSC